MRTMWQKFFTITAVAMLMGAVLPAAAQRYGDEYREGSAFGKMQHKLGRGLANIFTGVVEVPKNISREWRKSDPVTGVIVGGVKGVGWAAARLAVGVYDTVTFPIPVPANYEPLMQPETPLPSVWGEQLPYFDPEGDPRITR
ncbi:MAG: exosortase system-associated protein, TIGR04073 family [Candidatus Sumerlaeaceae bacterium]|nr:exosortase system-associated protein, TIGR04073 family [Candidatus Sumerlaeaceae bacterium]